MSKREWANTLSFLAVGLVAILLGFGVAMRFLGNAKSQGDPSGQISSQGGNALGPGGSAPRDFTNNPGDAMNSDLTHPNPMDPTPTTNGGNQVQAQSGKSEEELAGSAGGGAVNPESDSQNQPMDTSTMGGSTEKPITYLEGFMDPFDYDPAGKKDPFRPLEADRPAEAGALEGPFQPLQRFEVDQLTLQGIIWKVRTPRAMIRDPLGNIHVVTENTRMGRNNGYVAAIREGEVVIVEPYIEDGRMTYSTRLLRIK